MCTYYNELAHAIMETKKSQVLQLVGWKLRRTKSVVPTWVLGPEYQKSRWYNFQTEGHSLKTQEELRFQVVFKGRKRLISQL